MCVIVQEGTPSIVWSVERIKGGHRIQTSQIVTDVPDSRNCVVLIDARGRARTIQLQLLQFDNFILRLKAMPAGRNMKEAFPDEWKEK